MDWYTSNPDWWVDVSGALLHLPRMFMMLGEVGNVIDIPKNKQGIQYEYEKKTVDRAGVSPFPTFCVKGLEGNGGIFEGELKTLTKHHLTQNSNSLRTNSDLEATKLNEVSFGYLEFDIGKWPTRKKIKRTKCKVMLGKWEFDIWKWPKRKKKEGMFSSYLSACSLGYTLDIHQLVHLVIRLDIHQFVHLILVMDDKLRTLWLNETDMTIFEQYLVQYEAGIFNTKEDDQGELEIMMSEYLHTVNFKVEPYEGCWFYISTNKGVFVFIVRRMDQQR
ncbi:hypothetical protein Tco_1279531 [Tanacetum coccineum]